MKNIFTLPYKHHPRAYSVEIQIFFYLFSLISLKTIPSPSKGLVSLSRRIFLFHQSLFKVPSITMVFLFMLLGAPESRAQDSNFFVGTNYAWTININQRGDSGFAVDFGGHRAANKTGVSARRSRLEQDFSQMQRAGIKVVRWWVFPKFFGDGVQFDANGDPTGLGGTTVEDIKAAIDVAAKYDLQIMFCLFSFDNFNLYDRYPKLSTFIRSDRQEWLLINKVIKPFVSHAVQHAQAIGSPSTIHSWDIINEPDWAIQRSDPQDSSGLDFEPCEPFDYFDRQSGRPYNYCYGQSFCHRRLGLFQVGSPMEFLVKKSSYVLPDSLLSVGRQISFSLRYAHFTTAWFIGKTCCHG